MRLHSLVLSLIERRTIYDWSCIFASWLYDFSCVDEPVMADRLGEPLADARAEHHARRLHEEDSCRSAVGSALARGVRRSRPPPKWPDARWLGACCVVDKIFCSVVNLDEELQDQTSETHF